MRLMDPIPLTETLVCPRCQATMIPLTHSPPVAAAGVDAPGVEDRANAKCPGCGNRYRWAGISAD